MANVKLPDGKVLEAPDGTTVGGFAALIGAGLAKAAVFPQQPGQRWCWQ